MTLYNTVVGNRKVKNECRPIFEQRYPFPNSLKTQRNIHNQHLLKVDRALCFRFSSSRPHRNSKNMYPQLENVHVATLGAPLKFITSTLSERKTEFQLNKTSSNFINKTQFVKIQWRFYMQLSLYLVWVRPNPRGNNIILYGVRAPTNQSTE